jgi:hypothetical protein
MSMHKQMANEVMLAIRMIWEAVPEADRQAFYTFTGGSCPVEVLDRRLKKFVAEGSEMEAELLGLQLRLAREFSEATGRVRVLRSRRGSLNLRLVVDENPEG